MERAHVGTTSLRTELKTTERTTMSEKTDKDPDPTSQEPASSLDQDSMDGLERALTHFVKSFESSAQRWEDKVYPFIQSFQDSAKRWERMVYPAIIIFGLLGMSGFWLIYSLTQDMHTMARHVDPKMAQNLEIMSSHMEELAHNIDTMTAVVRQMNTHIASMDTSIAIIQPDINVITTRMDTLPPLLFKISEMNESMKSMTMSTGFMSRDVGGMNQNIGRPMSVINSFAPW